MATTQIAPGIIEELADLFASCPCPEEILDFRPSRALQLRARALLAKQAGSRLTDEEKRESEEFLCAETLMRLIKARIRAPKAKSAITVR